MRGIDPLAFRMRNERSTIWATFPLTLIKKWILWIEVYFSFFIYFFFFVSLFLFFFFYLFLLFFFISFFFSFFISFSFSFLSFSFYLIYFNNLFVWYIVQHSSKKKSSGSHSTVCKHWLIAKMHPVGFEPTHLSIAVLETAPLDRSGTNAFIHVWKKYKQ